MLLSGLSRLMLSAVSLLSSSRQQSRPKAGTAQEVLDSTLHLCCDTGGLSVQSNLWSSAFRELRHHADTECVQSTPSLVSVRHVPLARASAVCHLDGELSLIVLFRICFVSHSSNPSIARPDCGLPALRA